VKRFAIFIIVDVALSLAIAGWFVYQRIGLIIDDLAPMTLPLKTDFPIGEKGEYEIYHEYSDSPAGASEFEITLTNRATGKKVNLLPPSGSSSYNFAGRRGVVILTCTIDAPGIYEWSARRKDGKEAVLVLAPPLGGRIVTAILSGLGIALGLTVTTLGALWLMRRRPA
jgi:hypothetical protein